MTIIALGVDPAKNVLPYTEGSTSVARPSSSAARRLPESVADLPPCTIGMEACSVATTGHTGLSCAAAARSRATCRTPPPRPGATERQRQTAVPVRPTFRDCRFDGLA